MMGVANPLEIRNTAVSICSNSLSCENIFMNICRFALTVLIVCLLTTGQANAVEINLSGENVEKYFQILEIYVLPFLVVSTIVLLCGYIASKIYNRRLNKSVEDLVAEKRSPDLRDEGTAAFLREITNTPPIKDPVPDREPRLRLRRRRSKKTAPPVDPPLRVGIDDRPNTDVGTERPDDGVREPLLLRVPTVAPASDPTEREEGADEPAAIDRDMGRAKDDLASDLPGFPNEPEPPIVPVPTLTADPPSLRVDTREVPEAPALDDGTGTDKAVSVEPGDAPYVETSFDLKAGYDSTAETQSPEPPETTREAVDNPPVYTPPVRSADLPLDMKLNGSADDTGTEKPGPDEDGLRPPALDRTEWWADSAAAPDPVEPGAGVVQPLNPTVDTSSRERRNAEKAATDIVRSLDRITSSLQHNMTVLADHIQHRRGLLLEDVQGLRISGFSAGVDVAERLRALDQQSATDVHDSYAAVDGLNRIIDRLEQMAADEALDEGWNELIRTRLSETIYAVGQGKKTLLPHLPADSPVTSNNGPDERADDAGQAPHSGGLPFGTRQG